MAKRQLRESLKSEIDNLFKSPEAAEDSFQRATKRRRYRDSSSTPSKCKEIEPEEPNKPKLELRLSRLRDGQRLDSETLASFIHYCVFRSAIQKPRWAGLSHAGNVLQTLLIRVNVEDDFFVTTNLSFPNEFFQKQWIELDSNISDRKQFWRDILNVRLTITEQIRRKSEKMQKSFEMSGKHDRSHFVLTTEQLAEMNYPFPGDEGIVPTKQQYKKLSPTSPMFSIDCEMCETDVANRALTRISIIDEEENTILDTLVKPEGRIIDYVTRYSGITAKMMEGVTTTLQDVQDAVRNLLPPDAILVGHSLEHDLQAMKMTHPFCIDVGHILNYTNGNGFRNSLKSLTELFLGEQIQSAFGHCSYEDAWAAMRLTQLKLEKGIVFGNTSYGWEYTEYAKQNVVVEEKKMAEESSTLPCSDCSHPTVVECTVVDCRCRFVAAPLKCVRCIQEGGSVEGDFDWRETLDVDVDKTSSPIETYLEKDKLKTVMCAFDSSDLDILPSRSKKMRSKDPSKFASTESFLDSVASEMLNDSLILAEIDKEKLEPSEADKTNDDGEIADNSEALNAYLEKLVAATSKNALIMMIFSCSNKNILYVRVK